VVKDDNLALAWLGKGKKYTQKRKKGTTLYLPLTFTFRNQKGTFVFKKQHNH
jgi:hypothetical protein